MATSIDLTGMAGWERIEAELPSDFEALAKECQPKVIICGYSSYPWVPDFARFIGGTKGR